MQQRTIIARHLQHFLPVTVKEDMRKIKLIRHRNHMTADGAELQPKSVIVPKPSSSLPNFQLIFKEREARHRVRLDQTV